MKLDDIEDYLHDNASIQETIDEMLEKEDYDEDDETTLYNVYDFAVVTLPGRSNKIYGGTLWEQLKFKRVAVRRVGG